MEDSLERKYLSGPVRSGLKNFHEKFVEHLSCANKIPISKAIWLKAMIKDCYFPQSLASDGSSLAVSKLRRSRVGN